MDSSCLYPIGLVLVFIFVGIYIGYEGEQRKRMTWRQFAQANGLTFVPSQLLGPPCSVTGQYRGCLLA